MEEAKNLNKDGFRVAVLASGSTGNLTYIETPKRRILVDCGLSGKKAQELLASVGRRMEDVDSILVTHEHRDHTHGVGVLARRFNLDVYANEKTWKAMAPIVGDIPLDQCHLIEPGEMQVFSDIDVMSFSVSHDAVDPQFYAFQKDKKRFVLLTDTGYVSDRLRGLLRGADAYLIESNHDMELLRLGPYPWSLKQRILSDEGHLSNVDGAEAVAEMITDKTKAVYLGHLSQKNNMKQLAYDTAYQILDEKDLGPNQAFQLLGTDPDKAQDFLDL